jgi:Mg2+ and Co2+ transporter CorA
MSADPDTLIARFNAAVTENIYADAYTRIALLEEVGEALASALEQAREERREANAVIAQKEWERKEQIGRAEAAEADLARVREALVQARRDLWWFIEQDHEERDGWWTFGEIAERAMRIQDDVLGAALAAGSGDGR